MARRSLEAIVLSTFVLRSQNRQAEVADSRADLVLQINRLTENEVTRLLTLIDARSDHRGSEAGADPEIDASKKDVAPDRVLREIVDRSIELRADGAGSSSIRSKLK